MPPSYQLITDRDPKGIPHPDLATIRETLANLRSWGSVSLQCDRRTFLRIYRNDGGLYSCTHGRGADGVFSFDYGLNLVTEPDGYDSIIQTWLRRNDGAAPLSGSWRKMELRPAVIRLPTSDRPEDGQRHSYDFRGECVTYRDPECYALLNAYLPNQFGVVEWLRADWYTWDGGRLEDESVYRRSLVYLLDVITQNMSPALIRVTDREDADPYLLEQVAERADRGALLTVVDMWDDDCSVTRQLYAAAERKKRARTPVWEVPDDRPYPHVTDGDTICRDVTLRSIRHYLRNARTDDDGFVITARGTFEFFQAVWNPNEGWYCECRDADRMVICEDRYLKDDPVARAMRDFVCRGDAWTGNHHWEPHPDFTPSETEPRPPGQTLVGPPLLDALRTIFHRHRHQDLRLLGIQGPRMFFGFPRWAWILLWMALGFPGISGSLWVFFGMDGEKLGLKVFMAVMFLPYGAFAIWMLILKPRRFFIDTNTRIVGQLSCRGKVLETLSLNDCYVSCLRNVHRGAFATVAVFPITTWSIQLSGPSRPHRSSQPNQQRLSWPLVVGYADPSEALADAVQFADALGVRELVDLTAETVGTK